MTHYTIIKKDIKVILKELVQYFPRISGKCFLITGSSGLLGAYLVDTLAFLNNSQLLSKPCKVIGLSRSEVTKDGRLGHLLGRKDIELITHDVTTPYKLNQKVDYIIQAAGRSAPATFQSDPLGTIDVNVTGLRWLLDYAKDYKVKSVLYMSSGEIYGNPTKENIPTSETYNGNVSPLAPRACYTESKRLAETICQIYFNKFAVPVKIARPFIVYGPGLQITDKRVMSEFMKSAIDGKPIQMLNEGLDTRSYCYISDATILFFKLLFSNYNADPFNVASDLEEVSIRTLAETIHLVCGITRKVKIKSKQVNKFVVDAPNRVCPDITKAKKLLKYRPKVKLKEGIGNTVKWNQMFFNVLQKEKVK